MNELDLRRTSKARMKTSRQKRQTSALFLWLPAPLQARCKPKMDAWHWHMDILSRALPCQTCNVQRSKTSEFEDFLWTASPKHLRRASPSTMKPKRRKRSRTAATSCNWTEKHACAGGCRRSAEQEQDSTDADKAAILACSSLVQHLSSPIRAGSNSSKQAAKKASRKTAWCSVGSGYG